MAIVSSRPDAIVHIGTAKTGTTTLQHAFDGGAGRLRAAGLAYLHDDGRSDARELASASVGEDGFDDLLDERGIVSAQERRRFRDDVQRRFAERVASCGADIHTVLISSEHLHSRLVTQEMVDGFRRLIKPHVGAVRVVCYLRPQIDLVASFHSTRVVNGAPVDFADTCAEFLRIDSPYSNYEWLLDRWATAFGADAIDVRTFDRSAFDRGSIVGDFARYLGVDDDVLVEPAGDANQSIGQVGQMLLTEVNRAADSALLTPDEASALRGRITSTFVGAPSRLTGDAAIEAQRRFDAGNEAVRRRFRPDLDRLFRDPDDANDAGDTVAASLTPAEVDAFHSILGRLRTPGPATEVPLRRRAVRFGRRR